MNTVITMCDSNYFQYGQKLLETRNKVKADFFCYMPDATPEQIETLREYGINHKKVNHDTFKTEMQLLKFVIVKDAMSLCGKLITYVDFDTYFVKDWGHIKDIDFDIGITIRNEFIKTNIYSWAWSNGGVIFAKNNLTALNFFDDAINEIVKPGKFQEYNDIWDKLESPTRSENKRHYRTDLRWWVDQVYLSAVVMNRINNPVSSFQKKYKIKQFDCAEYNNIYGVNQAQSYIIHRKHAPVELKDA